MRRHVFLDGATQDLVDINEAIARASGDEAFARDFIETLIAKVRRLAEPPGTLGTSRPELNEDLRSTPSRGYTIYFRYTTDAIEVVNVLHASSDALAFFAAPDGDDSA